ncbi:MAG: allantoinase AllB [Theionarchaea archaeon]|nr:allantoinase AllB [Theionarchaea archaeon]
MADLNIKNGKVFLETGLIEAGISIDNGKIVAIGKENALLDADKTIDARNRVIIPGGIDVHTHILDLVYAYRDDFYTGTQAAASGGITTVLEMPLGIEGKSVTEAFDMQLNTMKEKCLIDFGLIGAAGQTTIDSIHELAQKGCIAYKTFMTNPPEEEAELRDLAAKDDYYLLKIFSEIARTGLVASVHAENDAIIQNEVNRLRAAGKKDFQAHTESRPPVAEDEACASALVLGHYTAVKLNLVHMSSNRAFSFIRTAKKKGWDVTCEVTPHHLLLTSENGTRIGAWAKVDPPLRSQEHVKAAWDALNDGTIDMVASDHSPYSHHEKESDNIFECGSGTPGVETLLPVMLDAVNKERIKLNRLVETTSRTPAKRFGIYPQKGVIAVNADADLVIVNMKKEYTIKNENMFTKSKVTVFDGMKVQGVIEKTLVRGTIVYDNGEFHVKKGYGAFITQRKQLPKENNK